MIDEAIENILNRSSGTFTLQSTGDTFLAILTVDNETNLEILASGRGYTVNQAIDEMLEEVEQIGY